MASQGPNSAGTGSSDATVGTKPWSNPTRVVSSDDSRAAASWSKDGDVSEYLLATSFSFTVPTSATINGILVEVEKLETNAKSNTVDNSIKLTKGAGYIGDNKADAVTEWGTSDAYASYGGASDLWGTTWTASDVNSSSFGVGVSAVCGVASGGVEIDHIRITVYYTEQTPVRFLPLLGVG